MNFPEDSFWQSSADTDLQPVVSSVQLEQLASTDSPEARQFLLDQLFTDQKRDETLAQASKDRLGRPVSYYRYMSRDLLLKLLEHGELTAIDHHPAPDELVRERQLVAYLLESIEASDTRQVGELEEYFEYDSKALAESGVLEAGLSAALLRLQGNLTNRNVLSTLDDFIAKEFRLNGHVSTAYIEFSPFISISVGGPVIDYFPDQVTYVEMVVPDREITLSPEGFVEENEVFAQRLLSSWITKVYDSPASLQQAVTRNPNTSIGRHYRPGDQSPAANWAAAVAIEDLLPTGLLGR